MFNAAHRSGKVKPEKWPMYLATWRSLMTLTGVDFVGTQWEKPNWNWLQERMEAKNWKQLLCSSGRYVLPLFK